MRRRALVSVSDKRGVAAFARRLHRMGFEIISTGGTARALEESRIPVVPVSEVTGEPEFLGGRVKTLHPKIHGGILANLEDPDHVTQLVEHGIGPIDLVCINLYPFEVTVAGEAPEKEAIEQIDIGGPAMLRAAAKNFKSVIVVPSPEFYNEVLAELDLGEVSEQTRRRLARATFRRTALYDAAIATWFEAGDATEDSESNATPTPGEEEQFPEHLTLRSELGELAAAVIVKHATPCGAAVGETVQRAYERALASDPVSAFGGIVALNRPVDGQLAEQITKVFTEVLVAPHFTPEAREAFATKPNVTLLQAGPLMPPALSARDITGGLLLQETDVAEDASGYRVVTEKEPAPEQMADLLFAWRVAKAVRSNAIVLARHGATVGIGGGQTSRVDASDLAVKKAGERTQGAVAASDAFFPFADGVEALAEAGITAVIQPGGSKRDEEVIRAANEREVAMVFTGRRHFLH